MRFLGSTRLCRTLKVPLSINNDACRESAARRSSKYYVKDAQHPASPTMFQVPPSYVVDCNHWIGETFVLNVTRNMLHLSLCCYSCAENGSRVKKPTEPTFWQQVQTAKLSIGLPHSCIPLRHTTSSMGTAWPAWLLALWEQQSCETATELEEPEGAALYVDAVLLQAPRSSRAVIAFSTCRKSQQIQ